MVSEDKQQRVRLVAGVRCAIRMRSKLPSRHLASRLPQHDIRNSINHVIGHHSNYSIHFYKVRQSVESEQTCATSSASELLGECSNLPPSADASQPDSVEDVAANELHLWIEGSTEAAQEEARGDWPDRPFLDLDACLVETVKPALERLTRKAFSLIGNYTTNLAESWMSLRCKFDGGKLVNRCQCGSWHARSYGAALRKNMGMSWAPTVWEQVTQSA